MANYKRLQCPLDRDVPEHEKLYTHVMEETGGKGIGEFLRSLIRLHREGKLLASQVQFPVQAEDENDDYMEGLIL